jgi:hypothetical protein
MGYNASILLLLLLFAFSAAMGPLYTSGYNYISRGKIEVLGEEHAPLSYGLPRKRTESSVVSSRLTSRLRRDTAYLCRAKDARKL